MKKILKFFFKLWKPIAAASLFTVFLIFTVISLGTPKTLETTSTLNNIEQSYKFEYTAGMHPCSLYPDGGIITPEGTLARSITDRLFFKIDAYVNAEKQVAVSGSYRLKAVLIAENYWEREYPLSRELLFSASGENNVIIDGRFTLDTEELFAFIDKVEEETKSQPYKYLLMVSPEIEGTVAFGDRSVEINPIPPLFFEMTGDKIIRSAKTQNEEPPTGTVLESAISTPITTTSVTPQALPLFGWRIPVATARMMFGALTVVFGALLALLLVAVYSAKKEKSVYQRIEKKYGKRLYSLNSMPNDTNMPRYELNSFSELLRLADERELPVFRVEEALNVVCYLMMDTGSVYIYTLSKQPGHRCATKTELPV